MTPITPRVFNSIHPSLNVEVGPPSQAPITPTSEPQSSSPTKLAQANAQALEVWQSFLSESAEKEAALEHNWVDRAVDKVQGWLLSRSPQEVRAERAKQEQALFAAVKERVESGKSATIFKAMEHLAQDAEPAVKERAGFYLNSQGPKTFSKLFIRGLLELSKSSYPDPHKTQPFLEEVFKVSESQGACHKTALKVYQLLDAISLHEDVLIETQRHLAAFQGNAGLLRSIQKEAYGINPINIGVEIGLVGVSGGVGNLAKAVYKLRYAPALWNSPQVLAGGFAVHSLMMGGSLGTLHVARAAVTEDIQNLSARKIGKIYLKDTLMVPVTHLFGATGKVLFAESALAQHGMGLAGMSTSTQLYLTLIPEDAPIGGITESIAADIVGYGTFTVGGKVAHRLSEGVKLPDLNGPAFKNLHLQMATLLMGGIPIAEGSPEVEGVKFTPEIREMNGVRFARIPAGKFKMGAEDIKDAKPVREVELSEYYIMENMVTNAEFDAYYEANQTKPFGLIGVKNGKTMVFDRYSEADGESAGCWSVATAEKGELLSKETAIILRGVHADPKELKQSPDLDMQFRVVRLVPKQKGRKLLKREMHPQQAAGNVTWYEAVGYAAWLDQQMREQAIPMRVSLPSEAQWEKAARGPEGFEYGTGDLKEIEARNMPSGADPTPPRVGSRPANGYGCHDMAGGECQWVEDWYQHSYHGLSDKDPVGPAQGDNRRGYNRVLRGGGWGRAAARNFYRPRYPARGFRVVAVVSQEGTDPGCSGGEIDGKESF